MYLPDKLIGLGRKSLSLNDKFGDVIAGIQPSYEYAFGSSAIAAHSKAVAVRNIDQMAEHFNPFQSFARTTIINSEMQHYQDFNSDNHGFQADRLDIWGRLPGGSWDTQTTQGGATPINLNGTPTAIAALGLTTTAGKRVGQLVGVQFKGTYYISAIVDDVSITLTQLGGSPTTAQTGNMIMWLPIDSAPLSVALAGGAQTMTFAALPPGAVVGASIGYATSTAPRNANNDYRIASILGNTITLNRATNFGNLASGTRIIFSPLITSGQIWTQRMYDLTNPQGFFAIDAELELYQGATIVDTRLMNVANTFNAMDPTVPMGAWPSFWIYGGDFYGDGGGQHSLNSSEVDVFENYYSTTIGPRSLVMNNANGGTATLFSKNNAGWSASSGVYLKSTPITGPRRFSLVMANGRTYRYVDSELIKMDRFEWVSQAPVQIGLNLACATIATGNGGANLGIPRGPGSFTGMRLGVKNLKIWHSAD